MIVRRSQDLPSYSICGNLNPQSQLRQDDGCVPVYPPEPPPAHQCLSDSSQPPRPQALSLRQVIEALHQRAAKAQPSPSRATPCRQGQYESFGAELCYPLTSEYAIRCELDSLKLQNFLDQLD